MSDSAGRGAHHPGEAERPLTADEWHADDQLHADDSGALPDDRHAQDPDVQQPGILGEDEVEDQEPVAEPTLAELLTGTARGEQAAFSAFYEATSDVVYGLALLMHADAQGAHSSTVAVYLHLWDQADARARDLRLQTKASQLLTNEYAADAPHGADEAFYRPNEYELVLEWLVPLAHRIFAERFRDRAVEPIPLTPVPQSDGGGVAGLPEEVLDDLLALSDSQAQALALTQLAGMTHQEVAETVGAALPSVKSRLRDAMTRLHSQRTDRQTGADPILRAAVTREYVQRSGGVNRNFTNAIAADLEKGLLVELAELYAMDAINDAERALLDERALTASTAEAQQWETRVLAARRTLAEIFASYPVAPPSSLLNEVLRSVGDQEVGVGLVEDISNHTGVETRRRRSIPKWVYLAGFAAVLLIGLLVTLQITAPKDVHALAMAADDAQTVDNYEMAEGGLIDGVFSAEEDLGYTSFSDVPELEDGATYQVWLLPTGSGGPSTLGNFTAEELEDDGVEIHRLAAYRTLMITVEEVRGEERPQGDIVAQIPLR